MLILHVAQFNIIVEGPSKACSQSQNIPRRLRPSKNQKKGGFVLALRQNGGTSKKLNQHKSCQGKMSRMRRLTGSWVKLSNLQLYVIIMRMCLQLLQMGNCVTTTKEELAHDRIQYAKKRQIDNVQGARPSRSNPHAALPLPNETNCGAKRNLFKTFSDWSDQTPQAHIAKLEQKERKQRKGSENLLTCQLRGTGNSSNSLSDDAKQHKSNDRDNYRKNQNKNRQGNIYN